MRGRQDCATRTAATSASKQGHPLLGMEAKWLIRLQGIRSQRGYGPRTKRKASNDDDMGMHA